MFTKNLIWSACFKRHYSYFTTEKTQTLDLEKESSMRFCDRAEYRHGDRWTRRRRRQLSTGRQSGRGRWVWWGTDCSRQSQSPPRTPPAWPGFSCGETLQKVNLIKTSIWHKLCCTKSSTEAISRVKIFFNLHFFLQKSFKNYQKKFKIFKKKLKMSTTTKTNI